jgi:DNA ligase-1
VTKEFEPMLAHRTIPDNMRFPVLASAKFDGIRAIVRDGVLLSRKLKPIPNRFLQRKFGRVDFEGFDGELILGEPNAPDVYRKTTSAVMSQDGTPDVHFHVFDHVGHYNKPFSKRLTAIVDQLQCLSSLRSDRVVLVNQTVCRTMEELMAFESQVVEEGFEGAMARNPNAVYKFGRCGKTDQGLIKLKRFVDGEYEVLEVIELMHNDNEQTRSETGKAKRSKHKAGMRPGGTMGTLKGRDVATGVVFYCGSGFPQDERDRIWKNRKNEPGSIRKYKSFPVGVKDAPRHPVDLGPRHEIDR